MAVFFWSYPSTHQIRYSGYSYFPCHCCCCQPTTTNAITYLFSSPCLTYFFSVVYQATLFLDPIFTLKFRYLFTFYRHLIISVISSYQPHLLSSARISRPKGFPPSRLHIRGKEKPLDSVRVLLSHQKHHCALARTCPAGRWATNGFRVDERGRKAYERIFYSYFPTTEYN